MADKKANVSQEKEQMVTLVLPLSAVDYVHKVLRTRPMSEVENLVGYLRTEVQKQTTPPAPQMEAVTDETEEKKQPEKAGAPA